MASIVKGAVVGAALTLAIAGLLFAASPSTLFAAFQPVRPVFDWFGQTFMRGAGLGGIAVGIVLTIALVVLLGAVAGAVVAASQSAVPQPPQPPQQGQFRGRRR